MLHALAADERIARLRIALPGMVEAALVLLLALQAVRLLWMLAVPPAPFGTVPAASIGATTTGGIAAAFFPADDAGRADGGGADAFGYRLHGVRTSATTPSAGSAILAGPDRQQAAYRVGDRLAGGAVLVAVGPDHALLRANGRERRLELSEGEAVPAAGAPPRVAAPAPAPAAAGPAAPDATGTVQPSDLLAAAGMRAHLDGGYTLVPRGDGALFRRAGLEPGDVLVAIDGRPLDLERLRGLQDEFSHKTGTVLTVKRGGQTRTINLQAETP